MFVSAALLALAAVTQDRAPMTPVIVYFGSGKHTLSDHTKDKLLQMAEKYKGAGVSDHITLIGHTETYGAGESNVELSQKRANSVRDFLLTSGIAKSSMTTTGFGELRPMVETADGVKEPDNNRVEITFGPGSGW